jgi:hypothetical protein
VVIHNFNFLLNGAVDQSLTWNIAHEGKEEDQLTFIFTDDSDVVCNWMYTSDNKRLNKADIDDLKQLYKLN